MCLVIALFTTHLSKLESSLPEGRDSIWVHLASPEPITVPGTEEELHKCLLSEWKKEDGVVVTAA